MSHHYEEHDRDKLLRWREELRAAPAEGEGAGRGGFPAWAVFLVRAQDAGAHEIFRRYRNEFEQRGAGFAQLVIFGMHGKSGTALGLLRQAGLEESDLPVMLLAPAAEPSGAIAVRLPRGASPEGGDGACDDMAPWQDALDRIRIARDGRPVRLSGVEGRRLPQVDIRRLAADAPTIGA